MARITEAEKKETPIYFQTRRESKFTIPNIALPPLNPTDEEILRIAANAGFYDKKATEELNRNLKRPNEGLHW